MPKDPQILKTSTDKQELVKTAVEFAASDQQRDQDTLLANLSSKEFLGRLDSEEDYTLPPKRLRLAKVLHTLMEHPRPAAAHATLVSLTTKSDFVSLEPRQELLIRALAAVRPSPPPAIKFWDQHSQPDATWKHLVMTALADNGSDPAVELLGQKLADKRNEDEERIIWMRDPVLRHRNDVPLLKVCKDLIFKTLEPEMKAYLVEALFDWKPDEWYLACTPPKPPELATASKEAKTLLADIAAYALDGNNKIELAPATRAVVEAKLKLLKP